MLELLFEREPLDLRLQVAIVEGLVLFFLIFFLAARDLVLEHDPAVDQVRCCQDVQERAAVRVKAVQARLRRLRRVRIRLLDQPQLRAQCV